MPYINITALPSSIKNVLPKAAQKIFMSAFNSAIKRGATEEVAFKIAWSAVKVKFRRTENKWIRKQLGTPAYIQGPILSRENLSPNKPKKKPKKI